MSWIYSLRRLWKGFTNLQVYVPLALFLLTLLPRVISPATFITWDEPMWAFRSIKFLAALRESRWAGTFVTGHPGVITTWLGSAAISVRHFLLGLGSQADWAWLNRLPSLDPRDLEAMRKLAPYLPAARLAVALIVAFTIVGIYLLARRLFSEWTALLGALLLAFDPFHLALSRLLHLDALTTGFMSLSLLSLLVYLRRYRSRSYLALSGCMAGLAALNKSPALFLAPFSLLLLAVSKRKRRWWAFEASLWAVPAVAAFFFLWPAMWAEPVGTIGGVLDLALGYAAHAEATSKFFLGDIWEDPGLFFYILALPFRLSPLALLGSLASLPLLFKGKDEQRRLLAVLWIYSLSFFSFIGLGFKKFDRYLLPIFPVLDLLAAVGLVELGRFARQNLGLWILIVLLQTGYILSYHPYYLAYYNPLLGGAHRAARVLPIGWGEGLDRVAGYLNQKEGASELEVAGGGIPGMALFKGETIPLTPASLVTADYVVIYISDLQNRSPLALAFQRLEEPEYVLHLHGIEYAWVYRNEGHIAQIDYIEDQAQAGDLILLSAPSLFAKHYKGGLPLHTLSGEDEDQVVGELNDLSAECKRIWYILYPELATEAADLARYQLATHAYEVEERSFPIPSAEPQQPSGELAIVTCHLLPDPPAFQLASLEELSSKPNFEGKLELEGFDLAEEKAQWGKGLGVVLKWKALRGTEQDYTAFLHLVDEQGHRWGQVDKQLRNGADLPTSTWEAGDEVTQRYALPLWAGIPPGRYRLKVGLYRSDTGKRLDLLDEDGAPRGVPHDLRGIEVTASPVTPSLEDLAIPYPLSREMGKVELLGYNLAREAKPGQELHLTLFWRVLAEMTGDYCLRLQLRDGEGEVWASEEFALVSTYYPTSCWRAGDVVRGLYDLTIGAEFPLGAYWLWVDPIDEEGKSLAEAIPLSEVKVIGRERLFELPSDIQHPMQVNLDGKTTLFGYDLERREVKPGGTLHLTLYWRAEKEMDTSYKVFTHLLDGEGQLWGQKDNVPIQGTRPTTSWLAGEVIVDKYEIPVKPDAPAGEYRIEVGMYDPSTGERLPVFNEEGERLPDDRVLLKSRVIVDFGIHPYTVHLPIVSSERGTQTPAGQRAQCASKVHREGDKLARNGKEIRLIGVNATWLTRESDFPEEKWDEVLGFLSKYVNCIRVWVFPGADLDKLERLLNLGAKYNLLFGITFETFQEVPEYPRFGQTWFAEGYKEAYLPFVKEVVSRFKGSSQIAFWQMMNEPNPWGWPWGWKGSGIDTFERWIEDVAVEIRAIDPCHPISIGLISVGSIGNNVKPEKWFKEIHTSTEIDLVTAHVQKQHGKKEIDLANKIGYPIVFTEVWIDRTSDLEKRRDWVLEFAEKHLDRGLDGLLLWQLKTPTRKYPWKYELTEDEIPVWEVLRGFR